VVVELGSFLEELRILLDNTAAARSLVVVGQRPLGVAEGHNSPAGMAWVAWDRNERTES
jgi:hypothetical protein